MAYYLYKKIRDKRQDNASQSQQEYYNLSDGHERTVSGFGNQRESARSGDAFLGPNMEEARLAKANQKRMRAYRWRLIIGLFFPCMVESLNQTIVATALPFIGSDFSMIQSSYMPSTPSSG